MKDRPRISVIVYGSILHPDDMEELFERFTQRVYPVRVNGFKRIFNQEASWRETSDEQRAVLNVIKSDGSWFNGILVTDLSRSEFAELKERERGYRFIQVESDQVEKYPPEVVDMGLAEASELNIDNQDLILTTTGKKVNDSIAPIPDYVELCKEGAESWGEVFLTDFISTTKTNTGESLANISKWV